MLEDTPGQGHISQTRGTIITAAKCSSSRFRHLQSSLRSSVRGSLRKGVLFCVRVDDGGQPHPQVSRECQSLSGMRVHPTLGRDFPMGDIFASALVDGLGLVLAESEMAPAHRVTHARRYRGHLGLLPHRQELHAGGIGGEELVKTLRQFRGRCRRFHGSHAFSGKALPIGLGGLVTGMEEPYIVQCPREGLQVFEPLNGE